MWTLFRVSSEFSSSDSSVSFSLRMNTWQQLGKSSTFAVDILRQTGNNVYSCIGESLIYTFYVKKRYCEFEIWSPLKLRLSSFYISMQRTGF